MKKHLLNIIAALVISVLVYIIFYLIFSFSSGDALIQATTAFVTLLVLEYLMPWIVKASKTFPGSNKDFRPIKLGWGKKLNWYNKKKEEVKNN